MKVFNGIDELEKAVGTHLGYSPWHTVTQQRIDLFADATGDHQWIHVDPEKAAKGPFGTTIAHGYLTLSLLPVMVGAIYEVQNLAMGVNYGANKIRFPEPVPVDSRIRATATLTDVTDIAIGSQITMKVVVEREGAAKPACVAEVVYVYAGA